MSVDSFNTTATRKSSRLDFSGALNNNNSVMILDPHDEDSSFNKKEASKAVKRRKSTTPAKKTLDDVRKCLKGADYEKKNSLVHSSSDVGSPLASPLKGSPQKDTGRSFSVSRFSSSEGMSEDEIVPSSQNSLASSGSILVTPTSIDRPKRKYKNKYEDDEMYLTPSKKIKLSSKNFQNNTTPPPCPEVNSSQKTKSSVVAYKDKEPRRSSECEEASEYSSQKAETRVSPRKTKRNLPAPEPSQKDEVVKQNSIDSVNCSSEKLAKEHTIHSPLKENYAGAEDKELLSHSKKSKINNSNGESEKLSSSNVSLRQSRSGRRIVPPNKDMPAPLTSPEKKNPKSIMGKTLDSENDSLERKSLSFEDSAENKNRTDKQSSNKLLKSEYVDIIEHTTVKKSRRKRVSVKEKVDTALLATRRSSKTANSEGGDNFENKNLSVKESIENKDRSDKQNSNKFIENDCVDIIDHTTVNKSKQNQVPAKGKVDTTLLATRRSSKTANSEGGDNLEKKNLTVKGSTENKDRSDKQSSNKFIENDCVDIIDHTTVNKSTRNQVSAKEKVDTALQATRRSGKTANPEDGDSLEKKSSSIEESTENKNRADKQGSDKSVENDCVVNVDNSAVNKPKRIRLSAKEKVDSALQAIRRSSRRLKKSSESCKEPEKSKTIVEQPVKSVGKTRRKSIDGKEDTAEGAIMTSVTTEQKKSNVINVKMHKKVELASKQIDLQSTICPNSKNAKDVAAVSNDSPIEPLALDKDNTIILEPVDKRDENSSNSNAKSYERQSKLMEESPDKTPENNIINNDDDTSTSIDVRLPVKSISVKPFPDKSSVYFSPSESNTMQKPHSFTLGETNNAKTMSQRLKVKRNSFDNLITISDSDNPMVDFSRINFKSFKNTQNTSSNLPTCEKVVENYQALDKQDTCDSTSIPVSTSESFNTEVPTPVVIVSSPKKTGSTVILSSSPNKLDSNSSSNSSNYSKVIIVHPEKLSTLSKTAFSPIKIIAPKTDGNLPDKTTNIVEASIVSSPKNQVSTKLPTDNELNENILCNSTESNSNISEVVENKTSNEVKATNDNSNVEVTSDTSITHNVNSGLSSTVIEVGVETSDILQSDCVEMVQYVDDCNSNESKLANTISTPERKKKFAGKTPPSSRAAMMIACAQRSIRTKNDDLKVDFALERDDVTPTNSPPHKRKKLSERYI